MPSVSATDVAEIVNDAGHAVMFEAYNEKPAFYPLFCNMQPWDDSMGYGYRETTIGALGELKERQDGVPFKSDSFKTEHTAMGRTVRWGREVSWDKRQLSVAGARGKIESQILQVMAQQGRRSRQKKDKFVANMLNYAAIATATDTTRPYFGGNWEDGTVDANAGLIYDGVSFANAAHPVNGSTYDNVDPTGSLTEANLEAYLTTMRTTNAIDSRGELIDIEPDLVIVPVSSEADAERLLESNLRSGTGNNDSNYLKGKLSYLAHPYFTTASTGILCERGQGIIVRDPGLPEYRTWYDETDGSIHLSVDQLFLAYVADWRYHFSFGQATS